MKINIIKYTISAALLLGVMSCNNFEDLNRDPQAAPLDKVKPEYFLNNAIIGAQMNPDVAERAFVLYWKTAGRQHYSTGVAGGTYSDDWSGNYWGNVSNWLNHANNAIKMADERAGNGLAEAHNENIKQVARIWRAYLMSEMSDNFGAIPIEGFQGFNPSFNSQKDVYYFLVSELKDAVEKLDESVVRTEELKKVDPAFQYDWIKWKKYANSMRMRLAMRMSEVDAAKAKTEFEDAAKGGLFISSSADNFAVKEQPDSWNDLTGVMTRSWNAQIISATLNNLYIGLGDVTSDQQLPTRLHSQIKPVDYMGIRYEDQYPTYSNDPSNGYWLDGIPKVIDPRAYQTFFIAGDDENPNYSEWFKYDAADYVRNFTFADGKIDKVNTKDTWNAYTIGAWGDKLTRNGARGYAGFTPALAKKYRDGSQTRVFFASWESYFLLAEAALKGWSVPMGDAAAYERGIKESLDFNNVSGYYGTYITSTSYNRTGTSVSYSHTTEPNATFTMNYVDGKTKAAGVVYINYPSNTIYKNGQVKNDKLTKIITQKFIANTPWLPLEGWSDHRRLGLPFFENPAVDQPNVNLPNLTQANYTTNSVKNFPQRLPYPSSFRNSDPKGYSEAVGLLGGADAVLTPMWWAKK